MEAALTLKDVNLRAALNETGKGSKPARHS
jgi:hypothetical protein